MHMRTQFFPGTWRHFLNACSLHANLLLHKLAVAAKTRPELAVFRARICVHRSCPAFFTHHFANAHADAGERKHTHTHAKARTCMQMLAHARKRSHTDATRAHERFGCFARTKTHTDVNCVLSVGNLAKRWFKDFQDYCAVLTSLLLEPPWMGHGKKSFIQVFFVNSSLK